MIFKLTKSDEEVLEEVGKIMEWYYENAKDPHIEKLIKTRDRLAALSYNLAYMAGQLKGDYNAKYYIRKMEVSKKKQWYRKELKQGLGAAEVDAEVDTQQFVKDELQAETDAYTCELLLRQVNRVLDAMHQRIGFMRSEQETNRRASQVR